MPTDKRNRLRISGEVVKIRLDTSDVMTCIDAAEKSGMAQIGMGMSQVIKWGIVAMAETMRNTGTLPSRDGFDYAHVTDRYRNPQLGAKVKVGIAMAAAEVDFKMSDRTAAIPIASLDDDDSELLGYHVPADVKMQAPVTQQDLAVIVKRIVHQDKNINDMERAKFMLYSPMRTDALKYMSPAQAVQAENMIAGIWPEYPRMVTV